MTWHAGLPYDWIRHVWKRFRNLFFSLPRPAGTYYRVDAPLLAVRSELGKRGYAPNGEFSYDKGEDLNLADVTFARLPDRPDIDWWQVHVRGYPSEDGVDLTAHWEPEPTEHSSAHIRGVGYDKPAGMDSLRATLGQAGFEPNEVRHVD